jgi:hypothetical protein
MNIERVLIIVALVILVIVLVAFALNAMDGAV